jgi:3-hydroxyacyl-CoA dehydrogenase
MTAPASFTRHGPIGLLCIDNPPVNTASPEVINAMAEAFDCFEAAADLEALVIHCAGRTFVAGGDIAAFERPAFSAKPYNALFARIEASRRPVVAALHGTVLGAGLELAVACHWRVAQPGTRLGLPEVKLGLLPGSLGTQRLPRLVGATLALDMMLTGRMISAQQALESGLVDELSEADPREAGVTAARALVAAKAPIRRTSTLAVPRVPGDLFDKAMADALRKPAYLAPAAIVRCVRAAVEQPFVEGEALEAREFETLRASPSSRALRHLFFAEREAAKIPGLPRDAPLRPVRRVGIVGAGTMGGGIAMSFANAGIPTVMVEAAAEALQRGLGAVRKNYEASAAKGKLTAQQVEQRMGLLTGSLDYGALSDCDLVIEAVFENLDLKKQVCTKLGAIVKSGAIIATNTSTLDVDVLAQATGRPTDVVGMHFFSPANVMRLLEVVRGNATAPDVLTTIMKLAQTIGKIAVVSGVCYGFIGNRMAEVYMREAEFLMMEGAEPGQIDRAVEALGMSMGPCRMLDMAGVDVGAKTVIEYGKAGGLPPDPSYRAVVRELFERGRFGQKTSAGYYRYEGRTPVPDPEFVAIARAVREAHHIAHRGVITEQEIVERLLYPLINEGLRILDEGIAYRPGDIDVVWVAGYGFPDHRGGPMFMADQISLATIAERLAHYAQTRGNEFGYWTPSPFLTRLAASGGTLAGWKPR